MSNPAEAARTRAAATAAALVASRPHDLHAGPDDAFVAQPAQSSGDWRYVPYERTYRGLPVVGGDFVVVVDPAGKVNYTSVAQKEAIVGLSTSPKLSQAAAEKVASQQLTSVSAVERSRLVVDAPDGEPRLAWQTTVSGKSAHGISVLTVDVDAATGEVLRTRDHISADVGYGALNGPDPLDVPSNRADQFNSYGQVISSKWFLGAANDFACEPGLVYRTDPNNLVWGDANPTDAETACVDATFAVYKERAMVASWLGGRFTGFPISLDKDVENNSFYNDFYDDIHAGISPTGRWEVQIDDVGHEVGHGIDDNTPGGVSGGGTKEFIADAFGTATEWFANEPAPYDTPDWQQGYNTVVGFYDGRNMWNPEGFGTGSNCYSSSIATEEVHYAAGVGDHWLYLLSEGSSPTNLQPTSPTCNSSVISGIGIRTAMQILYNAMLMKTSASSYPTYRLWTLLAAKNLFGSCDVVKKVRAAWDAVSVPPQPGEPVCVPNVIGFSQSAATSAIAASGLTAGSVSGQASLAPVNSISGQSLPGGSFTTRGTTINLTVSLGGAYVPNVLSLPQSSATNAITSAGFKVGTISTTNNCVDTGSVQAQSPSGGTLAVPGSYVNITVSTCTSTGSGGTILAK